MLLRVYIYIYIYIYICTVIMLLHAKYGRSAFYLKIGARIVGTGLKTVHFVSMNGIFEHNLRIHSPLIRA